MKNAERVSSLFFLIASVFILSQSLALPFGSFSQPESGFFPTVISAVLLILSLALFGRSIFDKERGWVDFGYGFYGIGITITTMVLYAVFLNFLGYLVCTLMAGGILLKMVHKRSWAITVLTSTLYTMTSYFGFQVFGVFLPQGIVYFL